MTNDYPFIILDQLIAIENKALCSSLAVLLIKNYFRDPKNTNDSKQHHHRSPTCNETMKLYSSALLSLLATSAVAFSPNKSKTVQPASSSRSSTTGATGTTTPMTRRQLSDRPIFSPPAVLDGELAGDYKFDPFNFSQNKQDLQLYREAEIRHARLAMLAAIGWPLAELWQGPIATQLGLPSLLRPNDLAPAVLNGNISDIDVHFFLAALTLGAMIEAHTIQRKEKGIQPRFIGDIGFDPLGAYPSDPTLQRQIQAAELNNGRLAMLAITGYALAEYVNHVGIIDSTPQFF